MNLLDTILNSEKTITAYYSYPTGTVYSSYVVEQEIKNRIDFDTPVVKMVEELLNKAVKYLNINRDNKTVVKCILPNIEKPVYFCAYDNRRIICFEINTNRGGSEYELNIKA